MRKLLIIFIILIPILVGSAYYVYTLAMVPVLTSAQGEDVELYLTEAIPFENLIRDLEDAGNISGSFLPIQIGRLMKIKSDIKPGYYRLKHDLSMFSLLRKLRTGQQDPIKLTFHGVRLREDLARKLDKQLALDSADIMSLFNDEEFLAGLGFRRDDALCVFLPNTYEVYWTISPEDLFRRMKKEYDVFWNEHRRNKASEAGLIPIEVSILASIVQEETNKSDEMARVAGVYINRLNKGMKLQADPTARFAGGNFGIRRVVDSDLTVSSPYNTYLHAGLPPGPICLPEPQTIDKVLEYEKHEYFFMVAKPDYSGYHNFSKGGDQHMENARIYRRFLDREGIRR
jgi:UPF0755 protein